MGETLSTGKGWCEREPKGREVEMEAESDKTSSKQNAAEVRSALRALGFAFGVLLVVACVGCSGAEKKPDQDLTKPPVAEEPTEAVSFEAEDDLGVEEVERAVPERPQESEPEQEVSQQTRERLREAITSIEDGDYGRAEEVFKALRSDPTAGALANYNLGVLSDRRGKMEEARGYFMESLRTEPDFSASLVSLVRLYLRNGDTAGALQVADRYIRSQPENMNHVEARLLVLLHMSRYEEVLREAKLVLRSDEKNTRAMVTMAGAYYELGKYELSEDILKQVLKIGVEPYLEAEVHYRIGFVRIGMKMEGKAIGSFQTAVELRPDFAEARNNLGILLHKARDYDTAVSQFNEAIAVYPGFKEAHLNLGNAYKGQKAYIDAEKAFSRAVQLEESYAEAYFNLGVLYLDAVFEDGRDKKDQFQQAIDNFNRYKSELKSALPREDPADKYIEEAKKRIELEKKREEMRREMLKQAEEEPDYEDEEGMEEEGLEGEGMEEEAQDEEDVEFEPEEEFEVEEEGPGDE